MRELKSMWKDSCAETDKMLLLGFFRAILLLEHTPILMGSHPGSKSISIVLVIVVPHLVNKTELHQLNLPGD